MKRISENVEVGGGETLTKIYVSFQEPSLFYIDGALRPEPHPLEVVLGWITAPDGDGCARLPRRIRACPSLLC